MYTTSLQEISGFVQSLITAFQDYIFFAFTFMMGAAILVLTRRLLVGAKQ